MLVKEIMTREVAYVTDQTTLQEAADTMKRVDAGELPVVIGNEAVGIVTDRDMVIRGIAQGLDPKVAKIVATMTEGLVACREDDPIESVARAMGTHKVRRLPVIDEAGKMTGMVSIGDLAQELDAALAGQVLMEISK